MHEHNKPAKREKTKGRDRLNELHFMFLVALWVSLVNNCGGMFCCMRRKKRNRRDENKNSLPDVAETTLMNPQHEEVKRRLEQELAEKSDQVEQLEERLKSANGDIDRHGDQLRKYVERNENLEKQLNELRAECERIKERSSSEHSQSQESLRMPSPPTLDKSLTLEQQCESLNYEVELKNEKIAKLQTSLNQKTLLLDEANEKYSKLTAEVNKIEEKNYKITCLSEEIDQLKITLSERTNQIEQLKCDLFENSRRSDVSVPMS